MTLRIITADERLKRADDIKILILGASGIGKTSLLHTLDPATTLALDLEAGLLAVEGWGGDSIDILAASRDLGMHPWDLCRMLASQIGGADPSKRPNEAYCQGHYDAAAATLGDPARFAKYKTVFIDSITVAGRHSFHWSGGQPDAFTKDGKPNPLGVYGLHGQEMIRWLTQLQHTKNMNIIFVGILDKVKDDMGRTVFEPQIEGSKAGRELPGIIDEVISMVELPGENKVPFRAFVCVGPNQWGFPAKDRSGRLALIEEPHLGNLMAKIRTPLRTDTRTTAIQQPQQAA